MEGILVTLHRTDVGYVVLYILSVSMGLAVLSVLFLAAGVALIASCCNMSKVES